MRLQIGKEHPQTTEIRPCLVSALVLIEVVVASLFVVGLFDAACQPWGWPCAMQFVLCVCLGATLWLADSKLGHMATEPSADAAAEA
jgi:hypothetical protein